MIEEEEKVSVKVLMRMMRYLSETGLGAEEMLTMAQSVLADGERELNMESAMRVLQARLEKENLSEADLKLHRSMPACSYRAMTVEVLQGEAK